MSCFLPLSPTVVTPPQPLSLSSSWYLSFCTRNCCFLLVNLSLVCCIVIFWSASFWTGIVSLLPLSFCCHVRSVFLVQWSPAHTIYLPMFPPVCSLPQTVSFHGLPFINDDLNSFLSIFSVRLWILCSEIKLR